MTKVQARLLEVSAELSELRDEHKRAADFAAARIGELDDMVRCASELDDATLADCNVLGKRVRELEAELTAAHEERALLLKRIDKLEREEDFYHFTERALLVESLREERDAAVRALKRTFESAGVAMARSATVRDYYEAIERIGVNVSEALARIEAAQPKPGETEKL